MKNTVHSSVSSSWMRDDNICWIGCAYVTFTRRRNQEAALHIKLNGISIQEAEKYTFLGITFDNKLNWDTHTKTLCDSLRKLAALFKMLTRGRTTLQPALLIRIYKALVRSKLDYGAVILTELTQTRTQLLERAQNNILRIILGCFQSTPKALLNMETGIIPVAHRWEDLATRYLVRLMEPGVCSSQNNN